MMKNSWASIVPYLVLALFVLLASPTTASLGENPNIAAEDELDEFLDLYADGHDNPGRQLQQTVERVNIWDKLKQSVGLTIIGFLLLCLMPCLIWKNEGRHVRELRRIDFCKNEAIAVDCEGISDDNVGQLVHFVGPVTVGGASLTLLKEQGGLNVTEAIPDALLLKRTCLIYQKFEVGDTDVKKDKIGGGETRTTTYSVKEDWTESGPQPERLPNLEDETNSRGIWDDLVSASGGDESGGGDDPFSGMPSARMAIPKAPSDLSFSPAARVGGFGISKEVIIESPLVFGIEWSPVLPEHVPEAVDGCEGLSKGSDGILRTFEEGAQPQNGDCMIVYEYVVDGFDCSFIVQQTSGIHDNSAGDLEEGEVGANYGVDKCDVIDKKCFGKCEDDLGVIWMIRRGRYDLPEMISLAKEDEKNLTKVLRLLCLVLLIVGWVMIFSIFTTTLSTLPILGKLGYFAVIVVALICGTLCCGTFTAIAYIRYRPLVTFGLLALAGGIWGIVAWRLDEAVDNGDPVTAMMNYEIHQNLVFDGDALITSVID